jgi:hypothetical protein
MDIEGAEMLILENTKKVFKKMVYEWSFDIDKNLNRFRECCNLLMQRYEMKFIDKRFYDLVVPPGFVAPCTNVFCYEKN